MNSGSTHPTIIVQVALSSPFRRLFDYLHTEEITPGSRVSIPFGRQQAIVGIVVSCSQESTTPIDKLRPIHKVLDTAPAIDKELLSLCQWCADYYHYPMGEICHLALPVLLRKPDLEPKIKTSHWQVTDKFKQLSKDNFSRAPKQSELFTLLQSQQKLQQEDITGFNISKAAIKTFENNLWIEKITSEKFLTDLSPENQKGLSIETVNKTLKAEALLNEEELKVSNEQAFAINKIVLNTFNTYLLEGVTGSGKTEVYLQTIHKALLKNLQVLVLVPEIGLTPQTVSRFENRFNIPITTVHSKLTDKERLIRWQNAKTGKSRIIIGTRSSIFSSLPHLGLIIVDEEHDLSFKQQEGVRYSARDVAIVRAQQLNIPLVLGSATPSLESISNAQKGRYQHIELRQRVNNLQLPTFDTISTNDPSLHQNCIDQIKKTLDKNLQALVFINRRGYAPTLICQDCGWISHCNHCDSRMTLHRVGKNELHCHHCDTRAQVPQHCPHCHSSQLQALGTGTQRSEEQLEQLFPDTPVIRLDRDNIVRKGQLESALDQINSGEPCIIVGTQMLAKGHHFAKLGLVVIIGLDQAFFSSDFRGAERMGQLLTQVAGRAGRETQQGKVLVQTQFADHPLLRILLEKSYQDFANTVLKEREFSGMPPFQSLALIRCHAQQANLAKDFLQQARNKAINIQPPTDDFQYLGPFPAAMEKRNNRYHFILQIKTAHRGKRKYLLDKLCEHLESLRPPKGVHWLVDIDPYEF